MSLFGSLMGDIEDDPIFGSHMQSMQHMNSMMNSFFSNPFGMMAPALMGPDAHRRGGGGGGHRQQQQQAMMPFGFPPMAAFSMNNMFPNFDDMAAGGHGMSSTSIMTFTNGPDGRPQVYQATKSTRAAPGGVKETKESVFDSRSGLKKMAIGHHIGEKAHIIEKKKDLHTGDEEEHQEFINLDDDEAESFNNEWETRVRSHGSHGGRGARADHHAIEYDTHRHRRHGEPKRLALTDGTTSRHSRKWTPTSRRSIRPSTFSTSERSSGHDNSHSIEEIGEVTRKTAETSGRKREHHAETEMCHKRHMSNSQD